MTKSNPSEEEALRTLIDLGAREETAREALTKCNYDVARAADFWVNNYMGNEDLEMSNLTSLTSTSWESTTPRDDSGGFDLNNTSAANNDSELNSAINASMDLQFQDDLQKTINASLETSSQPVENMALVLYNKSDNDSQGPDDSFNINRTSPEQPMKRMKLDKTTPLGLRPNTNYGYAAPFFQALFHIPIFRLAILAYRPTRNDWSEVQERLDDQMNLSEFRTRPHALKFMHEFQKLFGFLSLSKGAYGDANPLIEALECEENNWSWDFPVQDFVTKVLDTIIYSFSYCDLINLNPDSMSKYVMPIGRLLKSHARNYFQPEKKHEDVLNIILDISSGNTIYAALDRIGHQLDTAQKVFFTNLSNILILSLKHSEDYFASNSFTSGDSAFRFCKELYMDRYLLNRADDIERRWRQLESLKSESEKIKQAIREITEYQGRHNGSDLLKGSIDYFRRKRDKARNVGDVDDSAQKAYTFLKEVLEKVEQKLKVLFEERDEIDAKMRDIFNTPDMKKVVYRLKAVIVNEQYGQGHCAYIWVSTCNKTEPISSNNETGRWWKFCDKCVEEVHDEQQVFNNTSGLYVNSGVHTLIYVNADVDHNFSNIDDLIPPSLKEYVEKNNCMLDEEEVPQSQDYYTSYDYNDDDDFMKTNTPAETRTDSEMWHSDSTACGGGSGNTSSLQVHTEDKTKVIIEQAENMNSLNPNINKRFEIFCIKLEKTDLVKLLINNYLDMNYVEIGWDEPSPLDSKYHDDPSFKEYLEFFDNYKEITLYFVEGLDRMCSDEYRNALGYFKHAINKEKIWINNLIEKDLNGEKLQRSDEIDAYARTCLKITHDGLFEKIRSGYIKRGLQDALQNLPYVVKYIEASNCNDDELFNQFRDKLQELLFNNEALSKQEELQEWIHRLNEGYMCPEKVKPIEDVKLDNNEDTDPLHQRYEHALKQINSSLKKYNLPMYK